MRLGRVRLEWVVLAALLMTIMASCGTGADARRLSKDVHVRPLGPVVQTPSGSVRLQVLFCTGTIGQRTRAVLTRVDRPLPSDTLHILAATPEFHRHRVFADCRRFDRCAVTVAGWGVRPEAAYRLRPLDGMALGGADTGWSLCSYGNVADAVGGFEAAPPPPLSPRALFDLTLWRSTAVVLTPSWLGLALGIVLWRRESLDPVPRTVLLVLLVAGVFFLTSFLGAVAILAGLIVKLEIALLATAAIAVCVWRLSAPRGAAGPRRA